MANPKFDEADRKKVIAEVETFFKVRLSAVGKRRKYLQDQNNRSFWIFGGYENWHGIPADMMDAEEKRNREGVLVIAKRGLNKIVIYTGPLMQLIKSKKALSYTKNGGYQFNLREHGNSLSIKEVPNLHLSQLGTTLYPMEEKKSEKKVEEFENIIRRLSPEERTHLLEELLKRDKKI